MGISSYPSNQGLPVGAIAKIASGTLASGFASISGSFPAGKYLITSDGAIGGDFTTAQNVPGYGFYSKTGYAIINAAASSSYLELCSLRSDTDISSVAHNNPISYVQQNGMPSAFAIGAGYRYSNNTSALSAAFDYRGTSVALVFNGNQLWYSSNYGTSSYSVTTASASAFAPLLQNKKIATNGTSFIGGYYQTGTTMQVWHTAAPTTANSYSVVSMVFANNWQPFGSVYGNGTWINFGSSSAAYGYTTAATPTSGWTSGTFPTSIKDLAYGNGIFVGISANEQKAIYSTNGTSWTSVTLPYNQSGAPTKYWNSIAYVNGRFIIAGSVGSTTSHLNNTHIMTSTDGVNWNTTWTPPITVSSAAAADLALTNVGNAVVLYEPFGSRGFVTYDGSAWYEIPGSVIMDSFVHGSRGKAIITNSNPSTGINYSRINANFAVYALDSSYTTY